MHEERILRTYAREYRFNTITTEDVKFIRDLFGWGNCDFVVGHSVVNVNFHGRSMPFAGRAENTVTIRFTEGTESSFTFFRLRFPDAYMVSESWSDVLSV